MPLRSSIAESASGFRLPARVRRGKQSPWLGSHVIAARPSMRRRRGRRLGEPRGREPRVVGHDSGWSSRRAWRGRSRACSLARRRGPPPPAAAGRRRAGRAGAWRGGPSRPSRGPRPPAAAARPAACRDRSGATRRSRGLPRRRLGRTRQWWGRQPQQGSWGHIKSCCSAFAAGGDRDVAADGEQLEAGPAFAGGPSNRAASYAEDGRSRASEDGDVRARYGIRSFSGSILLTVPNDSGFELEAESFSGSLPAPPRPFIRFGARSWGRRTRRGAQGTRRRPP